MPALLLAFTAVSVLATAFQLWLRQRQAAYVRCHADAVPAGFSAVCTPEQHRHAATYELARQPMRFEQTKSALHSPTILIAKHIIQQYRPLN